MQIVAHRPGRTSVVLWIQAEVAETGWTVSLTGGAAGDVRTWEPTSSPPHLLPNTFSTISDTQIWMPRFEDLTPGTAYAVHLHIGPTTVPAATFRTLPETLERPFLVVLGSCYSEDDDLEHRPGSTLLTRHDRGVLGRALQHVLRKVRRTVVAVRGAVRTGPPSDQPKGNVSRAYRDFVDREGEPDIKILVGDQVYVDDPFWHFVVPRGQAWIKKHLSGTYSRTWDKLGWLLSRGGNYFTTDDHEFWNNFPATPRILWPAFLLEFFRSAWHQQAAEFLRWVQDPQPTLTFDIGAPAEITFFLADTRTNRGDPGGASTFMRPDDFQAMIDWIGALPAPGVLVIGQPLLARPGDAVTDFNLPAYTAQYPALCEALSRAPHDVLVLTGDIHYGRFARIELGDSGSGPRQLVEVVSSPLSAIMGRPGSYESHEGDPQVFPPPGLPGVAADPVPVQYAPLAPSVDGKCVDHFVSLRFARSPEGGVAVAVRCHQTKSSEPSPDLAQDLVLS